MEQNIHFI